jgi:hypothetical protein
MEWDIDKNEEELLREVIEALPRLKQYRLSGAQKIFVEKLERIVEQAKREASLSVNEMIP